MKALRILTLATFSPIVVLGMARHAEALTPPDLNNTCTTVNGGGGCFRITNQNTQATGQTSSPTGTAITAVASGSVTAVKGFSGGADGTGVFGMSTTNGPGSTAFRRPGRG